MPAFEFKTMRKGTRTGAGGIPDRLSGLGKAASDFVASIVRGLMPAPVLQPIPVRVRSGGQRRI
ncbi:hypothetical protein [Methylobacterium sp. J-076]|uniref:hypothetical protein n=1 Tax=Methylobacterium sp. J-076 TaxID=2836655 RepID=UPI001FB92FC5|nr:hypothetical protein [Methylobacterium sp. J-076]MCJ2014666.1 hypothetical protein [Methylobacterium sp. J-076]